MNQSSTLEADATFPCQKRVTMEFEGMMGYPLRLHLSPWQSASPLAWESRLDGELLAEGNFLSSPGISWDILAYEYADSLLHGMPDDLRDTIALVPSLGIEMAQVCGQFSAACELASSSPLLLILLVQRGIEEQWDGQQFTELLGKRQADICKAVGLSGTRSSAKLLRRLQLQPVSQADLHATLHMLHQESDVAILRHHTPLNIAHILFLADYHGKLWPGLLKMVDEALEEKNAHARTKSWLRHMLTDTLQILPSGSTALQKTSSFSELQSLHDRLIEKFNARMSEGKGLEGADRLFHQHGHYPAPPLPGTQAITPITSWQELLQEGQRMKHCVGSYDRTVALGHLAIYHMDHPQMLTISISPQGKRWVLNQARGICNAIPTIEAQEAIQSWLDKQ
ncbi:PcfJ domain-containing protein [Halomonas salifodinae]|uniref:PcfJ domain-containing protein n=1 Tax=Halomonas salifodinae TaxID=438745 RepID=A0ABW2EXZ8_9GAMM